MDIISFVGLLIPLFWTSCDVCPGFQSQGGSPHLHALLPVSNRIPRFTSGVTTADLLVANMAAEQFWSMYLQTSTGGAWVWDLSCHFLTTGVRQDWCSTNWAMPSLLQTKVRINIPKITFAMLAQLGRHQSESEAVPGTIATGGNWIYFALPCEA